ncbi:MAG: ATP synthase subunit I [Myxococcales bacterium]|nr:ATP synthase subunit I [Myxococcales bacterium]
MTTPEQPLFPSTRAAIPLDAAMLVSIACVAAFSAVFALIAAIGFDWAAGLGVALGGMLATANLWFFALVVRGVLGGGTRGRLWAIGGALKFLGLFGGAWLLMKSGYVSALALAVGYTAMPAGITVGTFLRPKESEPTDAEASSSGDDRERSDGP